jgi:hypothetical protein
MEGKMKSKNETAAQYLNRLAIGVRNTQRRMTVTMGSFAGERGDVRQQNQEKVWLELEDGVHQFPRNWVR